jgi:hypothetical protein
LVPPKSIRTPEIELSLVFGKSFRITFFIVWVGSIVLAGLFRTDVQATGMGVQVYVINPLICAFCCGFLVNLVVLLGHVLYGSIRPHPAESPDLDNNAMAKLLNRDRLGHRKPEISDQSIDTDDGLRRTDLHRDEDRKQNGDES